MPEPYRVVSALPSGTAFTRFLMVKAAARGDVYTELALAEKFKDSPTVHATIELQTKAAVRSGMTSDATGQDRWRVYGVAAEALTLLRGASIIGALESKMRRVPFQNEGAARDGHAAPAAPGLGKGSRHRRRRPRTTPLSAGSLQSRHDRRVERRTLAARRPGRRGHRARDGDRAVWPRFSTSSF